MKSFQAIVSVCFSIPVLWLGLYLTWDVATTAISFETHSEQTEGEIIATKLGDRCTHPSGGKTETCSTVMTVEYSFTDLDGEEKTGAETVDFWFRSEAAYAEELLNTKPVVSYNSQNSNESTLFPMRQRMVWLLGFLVSLLCLSIGSLGLYQARTP